MRFASFARSLRSASRPITGRSRRTRGLAGGSALRRPILEVLEDRLCPAGPYSYTVVAQTGSTILAPNGSSVGTLMNMSLASLNDAGQVAFLGTTNNFKGVDEWTPAGNTITEISFPNRNFTFPQIDNNGDVIA
jgi:hypothetical protein